MAENNFGDENMPSASCCANLQKIGVLPSGTTPNTLTPSIAYSYLEAECGAFFTNLCANDSTVFTCAMQLYNNFCKS